MKLQYQINAAFTTLLIVIMSVTAFTIYSLILNLLIQDEQRQLQAKGELLVSVLNDEANMENAQRLSQLLQDQQLQLFIYNHAADRVIFSTLPNQIVNYWIENYDIGEEEQPLWRGGEERFVVSKISFSPGQPDTELILVTPLNDLQQVQETFIFRLLLVFLIGLAAAVLLSYLMTKRLATPLTRLKDQLKKIEKRKFDEVEAIHASGEIKEVEESVLDMANELERYINSQQQFFQNASHELKTPLMTIQGYAEGIRDGVFEKEESDRGLDVMVAEIARLKKIINEMILLAKLDSEENIYRPENIQVSDLIQMTRERALPLANERHVQLTQTYTADATIKVDREKMLQAMMNVVSNAIRHARSSVDISVIQKDGKISIKISDDGKGIKEDLLPNLFHRFVKGEGGETGLGLAISRAIVERSGGQITAGKSDLNGALFTITFNREY
ncbi:sensor histidine kinase [Sediminibacillus massiliensis]|uniref:sensor histidine kinase n=1 Tax=Sediminibacillus massiliensis TaxID=1926277 RepID=UPI00098830CD|nr:HAMP domain-containing sensor histidine kinase [Sediminibacillus massiliensis]